jgi:hypothetical protein
MMPAVTATTPLVVPLGTMTIVRKAVIMSPHMAHAAAFSGRVNDLADRRCGWAVAG